MYRKHERYNYYTKTEEVGARNAYKIRVLISFTPKQHIEIIEVLKEPELQNSHNQSNSETPVDILKEHIEADYVVACTNAYVKDSSFGGHVYILDTTNLYVEQ